MNKKPILFGQTSDIPFIVLLLKHGECVNEIQQRKKKWRKKKRRRSKKLKGV